MANFNPNLFDITEINNGQRFENEQTVDADAINAPIEAAAYIQSLLFSRFPNEHISAMQKIGESYTVFGEVGNSNIGELYASMTYTRIALKRGFLTITGYIPTSVVIAEANLLSGDKISSRFKSQHGFGLASISSDHYGELWRQYWTSSDSEAATDTFGYAAACRWQEANNAIRFGRFYTTDGSYGDWGANLLRGNYMARLIVQEV